MKIGDKVIFKWDGRREEAVIVDMAPPESWGKYHDYSDRQRVCIEMLDMNFPSGYDFIEYPKTASGRFCLPFLTDLEKIPSTDFEREAFSFIETCLETSKEINRI